MKIISLIIYAHFIVFFLQAQGSIEQFDRDNNVIELCGFGTYNFPEMQTDQYMPSVNSCLPEDNFSGHISWIKFNIDQPGYLEFLLEPKYLNHDLDFELYNVRLSTNEVPGSLVRCNANGANLGEPASYNEICLGSTGMKAQEELIFQYPGCTNVISNFVIPAYTKRGEIYYLKIINQSGVEGFSLHLGGTTSVIQDSHLDFNYTFNKEKLCFDFTAIGASNAAELKWNFGIGATVLGKNENGNLSVKYDVSGTKKITLTQESEGCFSQTNKHIEISDGNVAFEKEPLFTVFPNPVSHSLFVEYLTDKNEAISILIHGNNGRVLHQINEDLVAGSRKLAIDFSKYVAGIYVVELKTTDKSYFQKIVKANSIK